MTLSSPPPDEDDVLQTMAEGPWCRVLPASETAHLSAKEKAPFIIEHRVDWAKLLMPPPSSKAASSSRPGPPRVLPAHYFDCTQQSTGKRTTQQVWVCPRFYSARGRAGRIGPPRPTEHGSLGYYLR